MNNRISQDDIIYFIITDRFFGRNKIFADQSDKLIHGGTLDGIVEKLDYLVELGITAIWVTPVYENIHHAGNTEPYHYYWPQNFERIDSRLLDGTMLPQNTHMDTFGKFVDKCAEKEIKVVLDMVVNHAGYDAHGHFDPAWFNRGGSGEIKGELSGLPDFNHDKPDVLNYFINNIEDWINHGKVCNIRMDTVKHVEPKFWHYFKAQIRGQYPNVSLIGEVLFEGLDDVGKLLEYQNYHDFDSIFDSPLCTAIRSAFIYDGSIKTLLARPRLSDNEPSGILDEDNPLKNGYRNANKLVTLLDNHDLAQRIMSHARSKHTGTDEGLNWAVKVVKLCLGAIFTMRGIPQIYYGTEVGLEGWKDESGDQDMRRDFPWQVMGNNNQPKDQFFKEKELYNWTRELIKLRKKKPSLRYGTTITLWSDDLVYAFLRISTDDVTLVTINNGYLNMPYPLKLLLNKQIIPNTVIEKVTGGQLKHWITGETLQVRNGHAEVQTGAKTMDVFV